MRKVIDGKVYDTEAAELIHTWSSGHYASDFHYCHEGLYRTEAGAYFIRGEGGARSRYAKPVGDAHGAGEAIRPLTDDEAREWLETHDAPAEIIESLFNVEVA